MSDRKFPILGASVPPMLGRANIMQQMLGALTKPNPDHLQLVGPRFAGKTVILQEIALCLRKMGTPYSAVILWDLGHITPKTDEQFIQRFAKELANALSVNHPDYAAHLKSIQDDNPYQDVAEVLDALKDEGNKVLIIMDGFDTPLSNGQLTRNLWDQLRELASKPSLRLITASRLRLGELIRNPDAQASTFWGIFDQTPVRVGCFNDDDLNALLSNMPDIKLETGAKTEIWNASNGFPIIMLEIFNTIFETGRLESIKVDHVLTACNKAYLTMQDQLNILWEDCSASSKSVFRLLLNQGGSISRNGIPSTDADALIDRGFAQQAANKLQRPNRMLEKLLSDQPNDSNSALGWLFGQEKEHHKHLKTVLEHRLNQIHRLDPELKRYLVRGIEDLPEHPSVFLTNIRGIINKAFELVWQAELKNKAVPSSWMSIWNRNNERGIENWQTTFPQGGQRVRLLKLMTGSEKSAPVARHITKGTSVLMDAVHSLGDFGQHQDGSPIYLGSAYAALHLCIELAASLTHELHLASSE